MRPLAEIVQMCEKAKNPPKGMSALERIDLALDFGDMSREELPRLAKVLQRISAVGHIFCSAFPGPCPKECDMYGQCEFEEIVNIFREAGVTE